MFITKYIKKHYIYGAVVYTPNRIQSVAFHGIVVARGVSVIEVEFKEKTTIRDPTILYLNIVNTSYCVGRLRSDFLFSSSES